jgi:hypothetical protein
VIVFTNKSEVKGAMAIRFGVYCYRKDEFKDSNEFLKEKKLRFGFNEKDPIRILEIETEGEKIVSSKLLRMY